MKDKKKKKCDLWEWVDQDEELIKEDNTEVKISILENNFWTHKVKADKESMSFRKDLDKLTRKYWNLKCCMLLFFVMVFMYVILK